VADGTAGAVQVRSDTIVQASADEVWAALVDWDRQGEWMLATRVRTVGDRSEGVGARLEAFTGLARVGVVDPMVVVEWEPPHRVAVRHTGNVLRGTGVFEVFSLPAKRSRLVWTEELELPLGRLGRLGWPAARPAMAAAGRACLRRLARLVEAPQPL
jgi:uncharacterized protein YndB with AHSA1/START domain